jgi:hypothetical protein
MNVFKLLKLCKIQQPLRLGKINGQVVLTELP